MECDKPEGDLGAGLICGSRHPRHSGPIRKLQLETLPPELLREIAKHLSPRNLGYFLRTSRHFAEVLTLSFHCLAIQQETVHYCLPILCWAISTENEPLARFLLGRGVDVNVKCGGRESGYMGQKYKRHYDEVKGSGDTPLHYGARSNNLGLFSLLLENGANTKAQNSKGLIPLHYAAGGDSLEIVNLLLGDGVDPEAQDSEGLTPLHYAASSGLLETVDLLLIKGANLEAQDTRGLTPLHCAARGNCPRIVDLLLTKGANLEARDMKGLTPLHYAAGEDCLRVFDLLLENGADLEARGLGGHTPLFWASYDYTVKLIERGVNVDARDNGGITPFYHEIHRLPWGSGEKLDLLLKNGADVNVHDFWNSHTPLHYAIHPASGLGKEVVGMLIDRGADLNALNKWGQTPLQLACKWLEGPDKVDGEIVSLLLGREANIDTLDEEGTTPLLRAVCCLRVDIVEPLLKRGANVEALCYGGSNSLHLVFERLCRRRSSPEENEIDRKIVELLLENGANIGAQNKFGYTALHMAAKAGSKHFVDLLLARGAIKFINTEAYDASHATALDLVPAGRGEAYSIRLKLKECGAKHGLVRGHFSSW